MYTIFGTGQLGLALMESLLPSGAPIRMVNQSGKMREPLPQGVTLVQANALDALQIRQAVEGFTTAFIALDVPYPHWKSFYVPMMEAMIEAFSGTDVRLVFADNLYAYGDTQGQLMEESLPYQATTRKGIIRAATARLLMDAHAAGKVQAAIGRSSDFIGPRITKGVFGVDFIQGLLAEKKVPLMGKLDIPHTFTYIRDFANGLVTLAQNEAAYGRAWHIPNAPALSLREWLTIFEAQTGRKARIQHISPFVLRLGGVFNPMIREFVEMSYQFEQPYVVGHDLFDRQFGGSYTAQEAVVANTLQWYHTQFSTLNSHS